MILRYVEDGFEPVLQGILKHLGDLLHIGDVNLGEPVMDDLHYLAQCFLVGRKLVVIDSSDPEHVKNLYTLIAGKTLMKNRCVQIEASRTFYMNVESSIQNPEEKL